MERRALGWESWGCRAGGGTGRAHVGAAGWLPDKTETAGLKAGTRGLRVAPDYALSSSSLCFQLLASLSITKFKKIQQKFLQRSPHPLWVLNIFRVWKSSLAQLLC